MDTRQLQTFITLAQCRNYQRAAEQLHYAPSSLFKHIQLLEEELGRVRFGILYLLGGLAGNALEYALAESKGRTIMAVGASGAVFALLGALLWCIILHHGHFRGMSLRRLLIYLVISAYFGLTASGVANGAHFGGLAFGFLFCILIYRKKDGPEPFPHRTDGPADERSFYG